MDTQLNNNFIEELLNQPLEPFQKILVNNSLLIAKDTDVLNSHSYLFNKDLDQKLPITDQKSSGRCWIFAAMNLVRSVAYRKWLEEENLDVADFELSQTYIYFWDKLERYHRCLRFYLDILNLSDNFKREQYLLKLNNDPLGDGGQWNMVSDIIKKYGVVPKKVMPDTFHSKNSSNMNKHLTLKLKDDFYKLSKVPFSESEVLINEMIMDVYKFLVGFLGKPPTTFNWTFKTKKEVVTWVDLSPLSFLNKTGFNPDDWVSIINDPRQENPYYNKYMIRYLGNTSDLHVNWINLPIERLKELTKLSINNNQPVWFGCEVSAEYDKDTGIHDIKLYDYESFMNYKISMSKEEKLRYFASIPSHAMVILGYHEHNGLIERWKIENSWGSSSGTSGFQLMSDKWFSEYVFQIVINKNLLKEEELNILQSSNYKIIEPWDPLGTLA